VKRRKRLDALGDVFHEDALGATDHRDALGDSILRSGWTERGRPVAVAEQDISRAQFCAREIVAVLRPPSQARPGGGFLPVLHYSYIDCDDYL
jgi:hypothetical protein